MCRFRVVIAVACWLAAIAFASAEPGPINNSIRKEPVYQTKTPKYGLLVFGPEAKDRVWLVHDGDTLYVDRNGNGDLTEPGKKVRAKSDKSRDPQYGHAFEAGDLPVGGKVHKGLIVEFPPLSFYARLPSFADSPALQAALKADPNAETALLSVDVESARLKGGGLGGRLSFLAGFHDDHGVLQFASNPTEAPVIHLDGPLHVTFYGRKPTLRLNRDNDAVLMVGTPGRGPGTFAMLAYQDAIPNGLNPKIEIVFPPAQKDGAPATEVFELTDRC
ncbi:MAG TPA: hypothetical protein VKS79_16095 [Gemmataceae bacterium]|nr:hypothetical protein [Gemmataceae bacterium]